MGQSPDRTEAFEQFREFHRTGSVKLRDRLVEEHAPFAEYLARRFMHRGEPFDDLRQVALIGLLKAVERFDPEMGNQFTTFAAPTIVGEIKRHFRDRTWAIRVPGRLQERSLLIERARNELGQELGRSPHLDEIATSIDLTEEEVLEGMDASGYYRLGSIDVSSNNDDDFGVADRIGEDDTELVGANDRMMLRTLMASLGERERRIVYLRYFEGLTQAEIAEKVGISQMHVSRLLSKSLTSLGRAATRAEDEAQTDRTDKTEEEDSP